MTRSAGVLRAVGASVSLTALFLVGLVAYLYGLSGVAEHSGQRTLRGEFGAQLKDAVAPDGPTEAGRPVAILHLPGIGLPDVVVVEGTAGPQLVKGPGHRADTVLPGQAGVSVIYGRAATFGAPFARLMDLRQGDRFTVTTGAGLATYVVSSFGDGYHPAPADSPNRLVLTTADSGYIPRMTVSVNADLVGPPQPAVSGRPGITAAEQGLAQDTDSLVPLLLWTQVFLLAIVGATVAGSRWARLPTYLCFTPIVLATAWNVYENLAGLLPNVY
ncbi:sortase [Dactylosporangium sp. NPDC051485]|uniref:sortase domain-containing protein n=1 Tax=Dactylosporangium sp. NPDC051485 TaxID=3154846 RepID=UPI00341DA0D3